MRTPLKNEHLAGRMETIGKFVVGGSITFVSEYIVFYALYIYANANLLLANSASFGVGLAVSYTINRLWAFKSDEFHHKTRHQLTLYVVLAVSNLLLNNAIVSLLKHIGIDPRFGKIIAISIIAASNYVLYQTVIFKVGKRADQNL